MRASKRFTLQSLSNESEEIEVDVHNADMSNDENCKRFTGTFLFPRMIMCMNIDNVCPALNSDHDKHMLS